MKRSSQPEAKKSKKVRSEGPKAREKLRIGNFYQEKSEKQLFTQWVDDDGHFGSSCLFKPLTQNLIYDDKDGLRDLDDNDIHDISILRPGDIIKRKWPYDSSSNFYHARVIEITVQPTDSIGKQRDIYRRVRLVWKHRRFGTFVQQSK